MQILIADSEQAHRDTMVLWLNELGHEVREVVSGRELLEACRYKCPDIIFLSNTLPDVASSIDVIASIRQLGGVAVWNPIVLLCHDLDENLLDQAIAAGADDYLLKPVEKLKVRFKLGMAERHHDLKEQVFQVAHSLVMANRALESTVTRDTMTGIIDVNAFNQLLENEWYKARKNKNHLCLILCNIDCLRAYNDTYGSDKGDQKIKEVAQTLRGQLPKKSQLVARTTGDTFAILLPETEKDKGLEIAKQLQQAILQLKIHHTASTCSSLLTASFGIAGSQDADLKSPLDLMEAADYALYQAKHLGRNRVFIEQTQGVV